MQIPLPLVSLSRGASAQVSGVHCQDRDESRLAGVAARSASLNLDPTSTRQASAPIEEDEGRAGVGYPTNPIGFPGCGPHLRKEWLRHYLPWLSPFRGRGYLRTRNRRIVTAPDRVLSSGSRSIRARPGGEKKRMPSPSRTGRTYTRISSTSPRRRH